MKKMTRKGKILEPIINNNFDGLLSASGVQEKFIRKFAAPDYIPHIQFNKVAKSLIVIGNHADRRLVIQAARNFGLKIIFIDPEGFTNIDGSFTPYPIEGFHKEDLLFRLSACDFARKFK